MNGIRGTRGADINATAAWNIATDSRSVVVAEVDSGVDYNHPDLAANVWTSPGGVGGCPAGTHGYNVVANTCTPMDDFGHGTQVAGVLGAVGDNGVGIAGVAWRATILPVKWTDSAGHGSTSRLILALDWVLKAKAAGVNVRVVNDSAVFSGTSFSQALRARYAAAAGSTCARLCPVAKEFPLDNLARGERDLRGLVLVRNVAARSPNGVVDTHDIEGHVAVGGLTC